MSITLTTAYKQFEEFIKKENLYPIIENENSKILVGVSGGSDSVFLLIALLEFHKEYSNRIGVANINYSLRGKDSDDDQIFVKQLCEKYGIPFFTKTVQIENKNNLEAKCRKIRFDFFKELCETHGYNVVGLAHILEDRVENVILRLIKGGSLESIIQPLPLQVINSITYIRPLLSIPKSCIIDALNYINQSYRTDKTNFENIHLRNKVRNLVLPIFDNINPKWRKSAIKLIKAIQTDNDYINTECKRIMSEVINDNNSFHIKLEDLFSLHASLRNRILIRATKKISNYSTFLSQDIIKDITEKIFEIYKSKNLSGTITIYEDNHLKIRTVYEKLIISKVCDKPNHNPTLTLSVEKLTNTKESHLYNDYEIHCEILKYNDNTNYKINYDDFPFSFVLYACIDDDCKFIRFREFTSNDKIQIGKSQSKSISKILSDEKIPIDDRKLSTVIETSIDETFTQNNSIIALIIHNKIDKSRVNINNYVNRNTSKKIIKIRLHYQNI